jgi:uncharacterized repeat protein (TIGR03803 family)
MDQDTTTNFTSIAKNARSIGFPRMAVLAAALGAAIPVGALAAPSAETIFSFDVGPQGANPRSGLIMDRAGALYGTTSAGGNTSDCYWVPGCGVVFQMVPPAAGQTTATQTVLYTFTGGSDGSAPYGGLLMDSTGALYGTTSQGGAKGYGVVFKLTPPAKGTTTWTETTLFSFGNVRDGATPLGALAMDRAGALYGTSVAGGAGQMGVLYKLTPPAKGVSPWTETELEQFYGNGYDGAQPLGGVVVDRLGTLFGTTYVGGASFYGAVFEVTQ